MKRLSSLGIRTLVRIDIFPASSTYLRASRLSSSLALVLACSRRKGKPASELILDQNYHHAAIHRLARMAERRGRPDIVHYCLLLALGSPLNMEGHLRCYVHTVNEKMIPVNPKARLPRQSDRFVSLLEQLFSTGVVPRVGEPLLSLNY